RRAGKPERMPGTGPERAGGMSNYVVLLKEDEDQPAQQGRRAVYETGLGRSAAFQEKLRDFLRRHGAADEVAAVCPTSVFPVDALRSTPRVAELVKSLPEVEDVVPDSDGISTASRAE